VGMAAGRAPLSGECADHTVLRNREVMLLSFGGGRVPAGQVAAAQRRPFVQGARVGSVGDLEGGFRARRVAWVLGPVSFAWAVGCVLSPWEM